ncbi:MAG: hypothetical protein GDA43_13880 [Hormoscilla sp. SP5CHS1]|nr:hypothetical protein [Hormoscilla sp. SP12CHS1]MBC6454148.1 hypothetical protein [Hormoscilla sp. SP5CHS1]
MEVENWANAIECREDLAWEKEFSARVSALIQELPNPLLTRPRSEDTAREWRQLLTTDRDTLRCKFYSFVVKIFVEQAFPSLLHQAIGPGKKCDRPTSTKKIFGGNPRRVTPTKSLNPRRDNSDEGACSEVVAKSLTIV